MNIQEIMRRRRELSAELETLHAESAKLDSQTDKTIRNMHKIIDESNRVADVAHNSEKILDDLDREFEQKTNLNGLDITFLFLATAIQCVRWYVLSNDKFRFNSHTEGDKLMAGFIPKSYQDILLASVPYDAIKGGAGFNAGLAGTSHRFRTLGHDPIMGWIFGQVNILSDSLTTSDFTSYKVKNMIITEPVLTSQIFTRAYEQIKADKMTLPAAILRQAVHFGTDYFTKQGLPVPFISTIDNDLSKTLLTKFNVDMWSITRGAALAELINYIVALIHRLFYDPEKYSSPKVYEVKTRKIIR